MSSTLQKHEQRSLESQDGPMRVRASVLAT
jgi:hypothetical protein